MTRLEHLRSYLRQSELNGIFIKGLASLRYFTGFTGDDSLAFIDDQRVFLFTDSRYTLQAAREAPNAAVIEQHEGIWAEVAKKSFGKKIGFEGDFFTYSDFMALTANVPNKEWINVNLTALRIVKEREELELLKKAVAISDQAFEAIIPELSVGMTELEAAALLEYKMREFGSEGVAFPTIVASGWRSALPHGIASEKPFALGDFVTFDFGAVFKGYHSDITRTIVIGKAELWHKEIYGVVQEAQLLGCRTAKADITGAELDAVVREYIASKGYGEYFGHGLGHGVGLEIHELPVASKKGLELLQPNMTLTIEPGIYIPGRGGVRIEDTVVITPEGCQILTGVSKQLLEII